jgi:hypothetical protein
VDLTPDQARAPQPIIARYLRLLGKLCRRLDALRMTPNDPMRIAAQRAYNGMHSLSVQLHYAQCEIGVAKGMGTCVSGFGISTQSSRCPEQCRGEA